jgi:nucleotide-binding universal stress UspA family protein
LSAEAHWNALGLAIGIIFCISLGAIFLWMFMVPKQIPLAAARARRSVDAIKRILVPTVGMPYSERGVELACRLGEKQKAEIILTYVIEVPRTLPLGASMPKEEEKAREALSRARAIVELHNLPAFERIERAREAWEGILRTARDNDVDLIVMGISPNDGRSEALKRTANEVIRRSKWEVILDKPASRTP